MKKICLSGILILSLFLGKAQQSDTVRPRPLLMSEYEKAKNYSIKDLDKDTYAKFDNAYILDRYEMRKPYFITGDDKLKKRIDLYKLIAKEGMEELGTMIYYTNENGKVYTALQPNFTADAAVWNKYFTDIDNINKEEKNFILKLSYILSKEMSFQLFKAMNNGKDLKEEGATYGTDICFPGNEQVTMADGGTKDLSQILPGDKIMTVNPVTQKSSVTTVKKLARHEAKNYALTQLTAVAVSEKNNEKGIQVTMETKLLSATPNHPMLTAKGKIKIGDIAIGDNILCLNEKTKRYEKYIVYNTTQFAAGVQEVYNIEAEAGSTLIMNGVMVLQK